MNQRSRSATRAPTRPRPTGTGLLGIYLNDHLAGATIGAERARHMARSYSDTNLSAVMGPLSTEIAEDRAALIDLMQRLDVPVRHYKVYAGRMTELVGRLKNNGRLVRRSPLTPLLELETLRLGVEGKAALWQTLRELADHEDRLDPNLLDTLLDRAHRQQGTVEELRRREIGEAFRDA